MFERKQIYRQCILTLNSRVLQWKSASSVALSIKIHRHITVFIWKRWLICAYFSLDSDEMTSHLRKQYYWWRTFIFSWMQWFEIKMSYDQFVYFKHTTFWFTKPLMDWSRVDYLWIIVRFLSAVCHSDGTHSLQRIHWWERDLMLNLKKNLKNSSTSWMPWGWVHCQQIYIFGWNVPLNVVFHFNIWASYLCMFDLHEQGSHGRFADAIALFSPPFRGVRRWSGGFVWRDMLHRRRCSSCLQQQQQKSTFNPAILILQCCAALLYCVECYHISLIILQIMNLI